MFLVAIGVAFLILFAISRLRDPRLLRNGVFLTAAIGFGGVGLLSLAAPINPLAGLILGLLALALPLSVVTFGFALISNGVVMLRREGRSLGNQLSLIVGVLVFALPITAVLLVIFVGKVGFTIAAVIALVSTYASVTFLSFAVYSVVYGRIRHRTRPSAIVIHGAGLRPDGTVTPLLRGRIDRALALFRQEQMEWGRSPILVPSGGKGSDEIRSEASAMAEYIHDQGVADQSILLEDKSTSTRENIANSLRILADAGVGGPILLVTSDYHVLRTASLARSMGADAQVTGARTARYFVPSAFLREFVAILIDHKWVSVFALGPFVALIVGIATSNITSAIPR